MPQPEATILTSPALVELVLNFRRAVIGLTLAADLAKVPWERGAPECWDELVAKVWEVLVVEPFRAPPRGPTPFPLPHVTPGPYAMEGSYRALGAIEVNPGLWGPEAIGVFHSLVTNGPEPFGMIEVCFLDVRSFAPLPLKRFLVPLFGAPLELVLRDLRDRT